MTVNEIKVKIEALRAQIRFGELMDDYFYTLGKGHKMQEELRQLTAQLIIQTSGANH